MEPHYFRDASNRLTHDRADIDSHSYSDVCRQVTDHFNLKPSSELVIGLDQMFWDFTNGTLTVELAWDIWFCFTVTAKEPDAELLVRQIALFLSKLLPFKLDL
ncbi:MAG: hypothetical protein DWH82_05060 [Planctomycetota bacterium]|nr:MAG: hypothetical protein DWH82_05060 [Planctomycetota bacterium]